MSRIAVIAHAHYAIREPFAGGLEMHTHLLVEQLSRLGHEVTLFAKAGSEVKAHKVVEVAPMDSTFVSHQAGSLDARRQAAERKNKYIGALAQIDAEDFDYVINNSLNTAPLQWQSELPMLTIFHTPVFGDVGVAARLAAATPNRAFLTVSETNAQDWLPYVPQVEVVRNGIDLANWAPAAKRTEELRWSARITQEKGLHLAIEAARRTGRTLRIAGPISDPEYYESIIKPMLSDEAVYVGHLSHYDLPQFLGEGAAALATPLWEEPFGLSVVEAFACGVPVAAFPRGAMSELINDQVGAVSTDSSPQALALAIEVAATRRSSDCRTYAESAFSADVMVDQYLDVLNTLTLRKRLRPVAAPAAGQ